MYDVIYNWKSSKDTSLSLGSYTSPSYDEVLDAVKKYGVLQIETIEKWLVNETESKLSARFYYIKND